MGDVTYFQRYSQKENWATNSTLFLLSRLYQENPVKFRKVIDSLDDQLELPVGVSFSQQRGKHSTIIDGLIEQPSFKILIESKRYSQFDLKQLLGHLEHFDNKADVQVLLLLLQSENNTMRSDVMARMKERGLHEKTFFISTTYDNLITAIRNALTERDDTFREILDDYSVLCEEQGLIDLSKSTMACFAVGTSWEKNRKFGIYYTAASRNHRGFSYIGLYYHGNIQAVGKLRTTVAADYDGGKLTATQGCNMKSLTPDEQQRVIETITTTSYYNIAKGHRFFLVEDFHPVDMKRSAAASPIVGKQYFDLKKYAGFQPAISGAELAKILNGNEW